MKIKRKIECILNDLIVKSMKNKEIANKNEVSKSYVSKIKKKIEQLKYLPKVENGKVVCLNCGSNLRLCIHHDHRSGQQIAILCPECNSNVGNQTHFEIGKLSNAEFKLLDDEIIIDEFEGSLEKLFSDHTARVIEWFILHEMWEQNQQDLCKGCNIYPKAMRKVLEKLMSFGIIYISRRVTKSKIYELNTDSPLLVPLRLLSQRLGTQLALKEAERQMV